MFSELYEICGVRATVQVEAISRHDSPTIPEWKTRPVDCPQQCETHTPRNSSLVHTPCQGGQATSVPAAEDPLDDGFRNGRPFQRGVHRIVLLSLKPSPAETTQAPSLGLKYQARRGVCSAPLKNALSEPLNRMTGPTCALSLHSSGHEHDRHSFPTRVRGHAYTVFGKPTLWLARIFYAMTIPTTEHARRDRTLRYYYVGGCS